MDFRKKKTRSSIHPGVRAPSYVNFIRPRFQNRRNCGVWVEMGYASGNCGNEKARGGS
jgi:hypothetical protein